MENEKEEIETDGVMEEVSVGSQIEPEPAEQAAEAIETEALQEVADAHRCSCPQEESPAGEVDADISQQVAESAPEPTGQAAKAIETEALHDTADASECSFEQPEPSVREVAPPAAEDTVHPHDRHAGAQPSQGHVIELRDVSLYHSRRFSGRRHSRRRDDELVLSDVNLAVAPGEMVYLIGKVGSGKSTLLKTLYAEVPLYEGFGEVAGFDLRRLRRRDVPMLRRKMGIVFQDYQLLADRNVFHNLHYVMGATGWRDQAQMRNRIEEVLGLVGLGTKAYKMPWELSGGEQQRLAIARALINRPRVILADEPTGNLDPAAAEEIMALFRQIVSSGCSIVMSTHNIANIHSCPGRAIRFVGGHIEQIDIRSILGITE